MSRKTSTTENEAAGPLQRGTALLRTLATASARGMALSELASRTGLPASTAHRLLAHLVQEGLATQIEATRGYALGPLAFELGLAAAQRFDMRGMFHATVERLAMEAGDTAHIHLRSGFEMVCLDLVEGPSPIRVVPLRVGSRRPLGLGAGGLAILAALDEAEREEVLGVVTPTITRDWKFSETLLRSSIAQTRTQGYALIRNRVTPGVTAIGVAYRDSVGRITGALSIASVNERMTGSRVTVMFRLLKHAVREVEASARSGRAPALPASKPHF